MKKERLPVRLMLPDKVRGKELSPYTYGWYADIRELLLEICPGYSFDWFDPGKWVPDYVFVDEETAIYLILKYEFKETKK